MLSAQALGALLLLISGFILGLAFDLYQVLRRLSNPGRWLTAVCDILFWLVYAVWIFVLLLRVNAGEVRFYVFLCIAAGVGLYFWLFSRHLAAAWYIVFYRLARLISWLASWLNRLLDICLAIVFWPYRQLMRYLLRPIWRLVCILFTPLLALISWVTRLSASGWNWLTRPIRRLLRRLSRAIAEFFAPPTKES